MSSNFSFPGFFKGLATLVAFNIILISGLIAYLFFTGGDVTFERTEVIALMGSLSFIIVSKAVQISYTCMQLRRYHKPLIWYVGAILVDLWMLPFLYAIKTEQRNYKSSQTSL